MYDIFFLSNNEPYSDFHWEKLVKRFPYALRINGIKGIHAAHREAAKRASGRESLENRDSRLFFCRNKTTPR